MTAAQQVGANDLVILGVAAPLPLDAAVAVWEALAWPAADPPWVIAEYWDRVRLTRGTALPDLARLRQLRAFTRSADLLLRVDEARLWWRLLADAPPATPLPEAVAFWSDPKARASLGWNHGDRTLWSPEEERIRLWGRADGALFDEPRMGGYDLTDLMRAVAPESSEASGKAAVLIRRRYFAAGRPQFERYLAIEQAKD